LAQLRFVSARPIESLLRKFTYTASQVEFFNTTRPSPPSARIREFSESRSLLSYALTGLLMPMSAVRDLRQRPNPGVMFAREAKLMPFVCLAKRESQHLTQRSAATAAPQA